MMVGSGNDEVEERKCLAADGTDNYPSIRAIRSEVARVTLGLYCGAVDRAGSQLRCCDVGACPA